MASEVHIELIHDSTDQTWWVRKRDADGSIAWETEPTESYEYAQHVAEQEVMFLGLDRYYIVEANVDQEQLASLKSGLWR